MPWPSCSTRSRISLPVPSPWTTMRCAAGSANSRRKTRSFARSLRGAVRGCSEGHAVRTPKSVKGAEDFGRIRLSKSFFMRDFLYSDIATIHRMTNLPDNPELAIAAGRGLCEHLLEPLQATFDRLAIRSAYRSPEVNAFGNDRYKSCGSNEANWGLHIWDQRSKEGGMGAMASIVVPW